MRRDFSSPIAVRLCGLLIFSVFLATCAANPSEPESGSGGATGSASGGTSGSASGGSKGSGGSTASGSGGATAAGSGGSSGGSNTCTPGKVAESTPLTMPFDSLALNVPSPDGHQYYVQVNEWNSAANMAPQTVEIGGDFFFKVSVQMGSVPTNGGPVGFPSHFIGSNSGRTTVRSNLPKAVSSLTSVPTSWTWNDNGTLKDSGSSYNAAYDVWFSSSASGDPDSVSAPSGGYLMVWYHKPSDAQPIGSNMFPNVTIPGVSGTWNVWIGKNGSKPCISYVATSDVMSLSYDLNLFIKDAVQNRPNTIQNSWALTNVFAGFEIWRGGAGVQSTSFCAAVN